jgi:class 3 adenylate cyclase
VPLFLDRHDDIGATPQEIADAHVMDLKVQGDYGVRYITYWFDPEARTAFCMAEGPDADSVKAVHEHSHGLVPSNIMEVDPAIVGRFLGRITEHRPGEAYVDSALRTIFFTDLHDSTAMTSRLGDDAAVKVLRVHDEIVRSALAAKDGREVKHTGDGIMGSFSSVVGALECAIRVQRDLVTHNTSSDVPLKVRIGLSAGEPVTDHGDLFGSTVQMAARLCAHAAPEEILVSSAVKDLAQGKTYTFQDRGRVELKGFDEPTQVFAVAWATG